MSASRYGVVQRLVEVTVQARHDVLGRRFRERHAQRGGRRAGGRIRVHAAQRVAALAVAVHGYVKCEPNSSTPQPTL
ncbi:hypothetical protein [Streptomyces sp. NPDC102476]|uniref:hypothetical protein n=1 Tax=Streptomyces sp. NPDC102476 TaxID=3366181 RepID=UPI00381FB289